MSAIPLNQRFAYLGEGLPENITRLRDSGRYREATALIDAELASSPSVSDARRASLTAWREIMTRMPLDYTYSLEEAADAVRKAIPAFTDEEFASLVRASKLDLRTIEGEGRVLSSFMDTLLKTDKAFARRAGLVGAYDLDPDKLIAAARSLRENKRASISHTLRASVRIKDGAFKEGRVRVHLPIPRKCCSQSDIALRAFSHTPKLIAPEDAVQRTVYFEETLRENQEFFVEYSYIRSARYTDISRAVPYQSYEGSQYLCEERPHIVFAPRIRALAGELTRGMSAPLDKARAIYDYITKNVSYAFTRSYFCMDSIADECARTLRGDCGVMSLLFITLLRCAGIPARWESGLYADDTVAGSHDWAEFYIAPLGWLPADPSFGTIGVRAGSEELRRFYFGNLDACRMTSNSGIMTPFTPRKLCWRADPYDNQKGEIEYDGKGLLYTEFEHEQSVASIEALPVSTSR